MILLKQVKRTYDLLDQKNKKKLVALGIIQMLLGFLDLIAISQMALFGYVGTAYLGFAQLPNPIRQFLENFGFPVDDLGGTLIYLVGMAVTLMITKSILAILVLKKTFHFLANRAAEISEIFGNKFLNSSYKVITNLSSQEATYAVARGLHIGEVLGGATVIASEITTLILLAIFMIAADPILAITLLIYFMFLFLVGQKKLGSWMRINSGKFSESTIKGDQTFQDGISLFKDLFILNKLENVTKQFTKYRQEVANSTSNIQLIAYIPKLTFEPALILGACLVGFQQLLFGSAQSAIATLVIFMASGTRILPCLLRLQAALSSISSVSGGSEIAFRLMTDLDSHAKPIFMNLNERMDQQTLFSPNVEIIDAQFNYGTSSNFAISNLSLSIPSGSSVAIVGRTGSGKSTLVDLILGILEPSAGSVQVSGLPPAKAIRTWPGSIGYVPQVVTFINGTVRENVALYVDEMNTDEDRIWECLEMVELKSFFGSSTAGLDSLIGERGIKLSGGQRQRLGIARALYSQPQLLILDEATSALDAETEKAISETVSRLARQLTLIVIAHRIATIKELSQIIYLENGQIAARGTFEEVLVAQADFARQAKLLGL